LDGSRRVSVVLDLLRHLLDPSHTREPRDGWQTLRRRQDELDAGLAALRTEVAELGGGDTRERSQRRENLLGVGVVEKHSTQQQTFDGAALGSAEPAPLADPR
jgi:hypothetical protein